MSLLFSDKQRELIGSVNQTQERLVLCQGTIRSGKTYAASMWFVLFVYLCEKDRRNKRDYLIAGKSVQSLERNVLPYIYEFARLFNLTVERNRQLGWVKINDATVWVVGVNDARAADKIQGMTAHGALVDEVVLLPQEFFYQLQARMSYSTAKIICTYNPISPMCWFKQEVVDQLSSHAGKILRFNFEDNPTLSEEVKQHYRRAFQGHFYKRWVLGEWAAPSGLVYPNAKFESYPFSGDTYDRLAFGMDAAIAGTWAVLELKWHKPTWWITNEIYEDFTDKIPLTDEQMVERLTLFVDQRTHYGIYIDPATTRNWKRLARGQGIAIKYPRLERNTGIRIIQSLFAAGKLKVDPSSCPNLTKELHSYSWDQRAMTRGDDEPEKGFDHACDAMRYALAGLCWSLANVVKPKPRTL